MNDSNVRITINGRPVSREELLQEKSNLKPGQRLVETAPNQYVLIERMNG